MSATQTPVMHDTARQIDADEYFAAYPTAAVRESPLNPRRRYDAAALRDLAELLRASGQTTPCIARPDPSGATIMVDGTEWLVVELGAGHRRRRALELARIPTMALVRRRMEHAAFVELLQVENLQRDDLDPLEEAEGFKTLMEEIGYDIGRIAARVGKDRSYVYNRLKLLQLTPHAQDLFSRGYFELGHAIILARLAPSEQVVAIGDPKIGYRDGGLFTTDSSTMHEMGGGFAIQEQLEDDLDGLKPVSTRELQSWVDHRIRFRPEEVDTPNLFPETAAALATAEEERRKVVPITYLRALAGQAKDPSRRTYCRDAWERADGQPEVDALGKEVVSSRCEHSVVGMVVAGPSRGLSFDVCVAKRKCEVHWAREIAAAAKAATAEKSGTPAPSRKPDHWEVEQERRRAAQERWRKARPAILTALAGTLPKADLGAVAEFVLRASAPPGRVKVPAALQGDTPEAVLRQAVYLLLYDKTASAWGADREWPKLLKPFGVNAKKIRDQAAPAEKPAKTPAAKKPKAKAKRTPKAKARKKLAGDVRRAKAAKR